MTRRRRGKKTDKATWVKLALIVGILYVGGILVPLATFVFAVQRDLILAAWETGNVVVLALAVAVAAGLSLGYWLKKVAERV